MEKVVVNKIEVIKYELTLETGLHIGGNKDNYGIGGIDSPVIKNPLNGQPIIPGSSLKGKIRMLLEVVENDFYKYSQNKELIVEMFGPKIEKESNYKRKGNITRVVFRDLKLTNESARNLQSKLGEGFFTEIKAENKIDKIRCSAMPRFLERVPAGAVFEGECIVQYQDCDEENLKDVLLKGFKLLENNYLGGSGSRGYGKVSFKFL